MLFSVMFVAAVLLFRRTQGASHTPLATLIDSSVRALEGRRLIECSDSPSGCAVSAKSNAIPLSSAPREQMELTLESAVSHRTTPPMHSRTPLLVPPLLCQEFIP